MITSQNSSENWSCRRLRFDARLNPSKSELSLADDSEVSFVPMEAVGVNGGLLLNRNRALHEIYEGYTYFRDNDVVVAKITPCFENGKAAIASRLTNGVGFGTTELHVVRSRGTVDERFLFYTTIAHDFRCYGTAEMLGSGGQKRVPERFIKDWRPTLPPLEMQKRISDFLDRKTTEIDALIERKSALLDHLAEKRQAIITQAVTKGLDPHPALKESGIEWLGQIPSHWDVIALNKVTTKITNGYVGPTRDIFFDEGVRYVQSLHIKSNRIVFNDDFFVDADWSQQHAKSILKEGDVLIVQTGDIGQVAHVSAEFEGCNCHALIICTPDAEKLDGRFLAWLLSSDYGQQFLHLVKTGALHPHLNCGNVKFFGVVIPSLSEQHAIADYLEESRQKIEHVTSKIRSSIERLVEYRSALITAAVRGKVEGLH